jgi:hypothetical protein
VKYHRTDVIFVNCWGNISKVPSNKSKISKTSISNVILIQEKLTLENLDKSEKYDYI